jgi:hypothetical protein
VLLSQKRTSEENHLQSENAKTSYHSFLLGPNLPQESEFSILQTISRCHPGFQVLQARGASGGNAVQIANVKAI